jgi:hypothetical protein
VILLLCFAPSAWAEQSEQPPIPDYRIVAPDETDAGEIVILDLVAPEGASIDWRIAPPEAVAKWYVDTDRRTVVFATRARGEYVFAAAVAVEGEATCLIHTLRNGIGPEPEPGPDPEPEPDPDPEPDPQPEPGKRFILVVLESGTQTPQQAAVLMGLRTYLLEKGHEFRFVDPDLKDRRGQTPDWFRPYVADIQEVTGVEQICNASGCTINLTKPVMVIGVLNPDRTVPRRWAIELPGTPAEAVQAVKERGG